MNNFGTTVARIAILAGGIVAGAFLAGVLDRLVAQQAHEQTDYDKTRYAQGLTPVAPPTTLTPEEHQGQEEYQG